MSNIVMLHIILDQFLGLENESVDPFPIAPKPGSKNRKNVRKLSTQMAVIGNQHLLMFQGL